LESKRREVVSEDKKRIAGYFNGKYPLSGKIKCGKCGRSYYHATYSAMTHDLWECSGYREFGKKHINGCDNIKVYDYEMDGIIKGAIYDFWQNKDENIKKVMSLLERVIKEDTNQKSVDKLLKEKDSITRKKDKIIELYSEELIKKEDFVTRNNSLDDQLKKIESRIEKAEANHQVLNDKKERLDTIQKILESQFKGKDGISDEIIECLVKSIVVYPDRKIEVTLDGNFNYKATFNENNYQIVADLR